MAKVNFESDDRRKYVRNIFPFPFIEKEELWKKPLGNGKYTYDWAQKVDQFERLYKQKTLSIMRKYRIVRGPLVPRDYLDLMLASNYDPTREAFTTRAEICRQDETLGIETWRRLKNQRLNPNYPPQEEKEEKGLRDDRSTEMPNHFSNSPNLMKRLALENAPNRKEGFGNHELVYGGTSGKLDPYSVKIGISSEHTSQTNNGYIRKVDGTYFSS